MYVKPLRKSATDDGGSAAIEFALVAPMLIVLVFGTFLASSVGAVINGLEQIAAGAARSTVAGVTDAERTSLATSYVSSHASAYPYLNPAMLATTTSSNPATRTFTVAIAYDMSRNPIVIIARSILPLNFTTVTRSSVIMYGGS